MLCEKCKQQDAVFKYKGGPEHARVWNVCKTCLEQLMPGISEEMKKAMESGKQCGWTSYSPDSN